MSSGEATEELCGFNFRDLVRGFDGLVDPSCWLICASDPNLKAIRISECGDELGL